MPPVDSLFRNQFLLNSSQFGPIAIYDHLPKTKLTHSSVFSLQQVAIFNKLTMSKFYKVQLIVALFIERLTKCSFRHLPRTCISNHRNLSLYINEVSLDESQRQASQVCMKVNVRRRQLLYTKKYKLTLESNVYTEKNSYFCSDLEECNCNLFVIICGCSG